MKTLLNGNWHLDRVGKSTIRSDLWFKVRMPDLPGNVYSVAYYRYMFQEPRFIVYEPYTDSRKYDPLQVIGHVRNIRTPDMSNELHAQVLIYEIHRANFEVLCCGKQELVALCAVERNGEGKIVTCDIQNLVLVSLPLHTQDGSR